MTSMRDSSGGRVVLRLTPAPTGIQSAFAALGRHLELEDFAMDDEGWASFEVDGRLQVEVGWLDDGAGLMMLADLAREITAKDASTMVALMQLAHETWLAGDGQIGLTRDAVPRVVVMQRADPQRLDHQGICRAMDAFLDLVDDALALCAMGPELHWPGTQVEAGWPACGQRA